MDINVQLLKDLKGEIDAANIKIDEEKAEWKNATTAEDKAFYERSIQRLEEKEKDLIDHRKQLTTTNASSSSQGKDISMAVSPAKLCSRYMRTVAILVVSVQMLPLCLRLRLVYSVFLNNFCHICVC